MHYLQIKSYEEGLFLNGHRSRHRSLRTKKSAPNGFFFKHVPKSSSKRPRKSVIKGRTQVLTSRFNSLYSKRSTNLDVLLAYFDARRSGASSLDTFYGDVRYRIRLIYK